MKDQIIITMGREHGSGGHYIADMIARELGIKLYDKDSIESEIVSEGYSEELIRRMDEKPVNFFASRRIGRFSNSLEVNVAEKTFDMIRAKAASGESFLLIGRCGEQVLKENPNMISIFICGDPQFKLTRVMDKLGLGYDVLKEINPRIIYAAVSGFGCYGPYHLRPGYDILAQAMGGMMSITGSKGGEPTRAGSETAKLLVDYIRGFMAQD